MNTTEAPLLSVEGLEVRFGMDTPVVRGVDLAVPPGHTVAVVDFPDPDSPTTATV